MTSSKFASLTPTWSECETNQTDNFYCNNFKTSNKRESTDETLLLPFTSSGLQGVLKIHQFLPLHFSIFKKLKWSWKLVKYSNILTISSSLTILSFVLTHQSFCYILHCSDESYITNFTRWDKSPKSNLNILMNSINKKKWKNPNQCPYIV